VKEEQRCRGTSVSVPLGRNFAGFFASLRKEKRTIGKEDKRSKGKKDFNSS
jgi:hypothetical protein